MLLYDKKDDSIDIYTIEAKKEKLKIYKEGILKEYKNENILYELGTTNKETINNFNSSEKINSEDLLYNNSTFWSIGYWSKIFQAEKNYEAQETILKKYIEGDYNSIPIKVFTQSSFGVSKFDLDAYYLLKTENEKIITKTDSAPYFTIKNMINLPKELYLLQLLINGKFESLAPQDITKQLQLFDIKYNKNIKISEIKEMLETGLVNGSIDNVIKKAETGSRIIQKIKKI